MAWEKLNVDFRGFGIWVTKGPSTQDPMAVFSRTVNVMLYRWKWSKGFGRGPGSGPLEFTPVINNRYFKSDTQGNITAK